MQRFYGIAQDTSGNIIPSATVTVNLAGTATLATLFSDNAYTPQTNPFTSETDGVYQFYARDGRYDVVLTKTGYTFDNDDTANTLLDDDMSVISPAQITADQNNYSPTNALNAMTWRINSDAVRTITGIAAGVTQQQIVLTNIGAFAILLANESSSSVAANRITTGVGSTLTLGVNQSISLYYDLTSARWRVTSATIGPATGAAVQTLTRVVTDATTSNSIAETDLLNYTVVGGTLGTASQLRLTAWLNITNQSGGNVTYTFRLRYAGTAAVTVLAGAIATGTNNNVTLEGMLSANNATNSQDSFLWYRRENIAYGFIEGSVTAIDSTVNQTLRLTGQMDTADVNASFTVHLLTLEWLP